MRGRCVSVCSPGPELGMEGVGTAMGMPIPLLPLFSLLPLPPLLPLGEEKERGHYYSRHPVQTAQRVTLLPDVELYDELLYESCMTKH